MAVVALLAVVAEHSSFLIASVLPQRALDRVAESCDQSKPRRRGCVNRDDAVAAAGYMFSGVTVAVAYQLLLATTLPAWVLPGLSSSSDTLQSYIIYAKRVESSFVSQNREGIAGVCGFFSIYLCGVALGRLLLDPARRSILQWWRFARLNAVFSLALWLAYFASVFVAGPVSRRLVNLPYVLWVLAFNTSQVLLLLGIELVTNVYTGSARSLDARDAVAVAAVHGETGVPAAVPKLSRQNGSGSSSGLQGLSASAASVFRGSGGISSASGLNNRGGRVSSDSEPSDINDGISSEHSDDSAPHEGDTGSSPSRLRTYIPSHIDGSADEDDDSVTSPGAKLRFADLLRRVGGGRIRTQARTAQATPAVSQYSSAATGPSWSSESPRDGLQSDISSHDGDGGSGGSGGRSNVGGRLQQLARPLSSLPGVPRTVAEGGSVLVEAVSANFLAVFVLSNLLVGVVNAAVETLDTPDAFAIVLLVVYMFVICAAAIALRLQRISLKFW
jgi:hypothetical protein